MAQLTIEDILRIFALSILAVTAVTSNLTVCVALYRNVKLRTTFSLMIFSLAVADLLTGLIVIPSYCVFIAEETLHRDKAGAYFYAVYICFDIFCGIASIYNMTLMSLERAITIVAPSFHARTLANKKSMKKLLPIPWIVAVILLFPKIAMYTKVMDAKMIAIFYFILAFAIPLSVIIVCYGYIFHVRVKLAANCGNRFLKDLRLAYTVLAIIVIFFLCWAPFFSMVLYFGLCTKCAPVNSLLIFFKWLQFFHSCCNPFIYALLQPAFRHAFKETMQRCLAWKKEISARGDLERQPMSDCTIIDE
ncbi:probable G-protein coupled receptor No9 [Rhopilema esculentum]|uniref:probable G-protein coupled receptor No9 n=1 Tax=Rhopilema esculentum TaxID=499914 RepID=UPI0031CDE8EA|eukprot:gene14522-5584_t